VGPDRQLSRRAHSSVQPAPRTSPASATVANNYHKLKDKLEAICELNHHLLRPDSAAEPRKGKDD
jgi:hypothetical protein